MTPEELRVKIDEVRTLIGGAKRNARSWPTRSKTSLITPW
jgi:hypothetical protein